MLLAELFRRAKIEEQAIFLPESQARAIDIQSLSDDSRAAQKETLFTATPQGLPYIDSILQEKKAAAILLDHKDLEKPSVKKWLSAHRKVQGEAGKSGKTGEGEEVAIFACRELLKAQGAIASILYGEPSRQLQMIGVTGTNGKTTTAWILYHIWNHLRKEQGEQSGGAGMIGTLGAWWEGPQGKVIQNTGYTTPRAPTLHSLLKSMLNDGVKKVVVEVSSEGLDLGRLYGIEWDRAIFTNLSPEHLDYHNDMESYYQAKKKLFDLCAKQQGELLICCQDKSGLRLKRDFQRYPRLLSLAKPLIEKKQLPACFPGEFNRINASLALLATDYHKDPKSYREMLSALQRLPAPPGRFEIIYPDGQLAAELRERIFGIVDYAHTPEALSNLLKSAREMAACIVCVFGCGGERDQGKRPMMGAIAARLADHVIITDDNPRNEDAAQIRRAIMQGIEEIEDHKDNAAEIAERQAAIENGVELALEAGLKQKRWPATVIVAGKGHESQQILKRGSIPFSDKEALKAAFQKHHQALDLAFRLGKPTQT